MPTYPRVLDEAKTVDGSSTYAPGGVNNAAATSAQKFQLQPRSLPAFAVPTLRPTSPGNIAFDVMPNGGPFDTWIDVCNADCLNVANPVNVSVARVFSGTNVGYVGGAVWGNTPSTYQFSVMVPTNNNGANTIATRWNPATGGVAVGDDYTLTADPYIILGFHGGSVLSNIWRLKQDANLGFFHLPVINGAPSGTPATIGSGASVPMAYDKGAHKLWAYEYGGGGWKSVTLA